MLAPEVELKFDTIDGLAYIVSHFPDFVQDTGETVYKGWMGRWLDQLRRYPGPVKYPIEWRSPAQMRYYFGVIAKRDAQGNIIPYQRTRQLANSWATAFASAAGGFEVHLKSAEYAPFVMGRVEPGGAEWQQPFHRNTGWDSANLIATQATADYLNLFDTRLNTLLGNIA